MPGAGVVHDINRDQQGMGLLRTAFHENMV
jgi:hypothetical protein